MLGNNNLVVIEIIGYTTLTDLFIKNYISFACVISCCDKIHLKK